MNPREYARNILEETVLNHGFASLLLRKQSGFSTRDHALISEIVYGTLRSWTFLQYQWEDLVNTKVRPKTAVLLNMAVYQLLYMDRIPAYAVISESVDLASKKEQKFVNAVLRKVSARGMKQAHGDTPLETAALQYSHPLWIMNLWKAHYGEETAIRIAEHDSTRACVYGRINTLKATKEELEQIPEVHFVNDISFTYDGILTDSDIFREGKAVIQDIASAMIPQYLDVMPGMSVLDVCAAPGTKTQETAMFMQNQGKILAGDLYEHRVKLIGSLMERTGVSIVTAQVRDGIACSDSDSYDRVLIDAPCSGLGDLRGKPEIRLHTKPEDLDELVRTQKALLENNGRLVRPGGVLVYSTCTLNRKENEGQIQNYLKGHPEFTLVKEKTFFPFEMNSDGFYAAVLAKK